VLCCAALRCAVLCCAALRCAVLCCVVLCCAVLCCVVLCFAVLSCPSSIQITLLTLPQPVSSTSSPSNCEETLLESRQIDLLFDDMLRDREQQRLRQLETTPAGADEDGYSHIPTPAHLPAAPGVPAERTKVDWHGML
jgi:hypothetical protein